MEVTVFMHEIVLSGSLNIYLCILMLNFIIKKSILFSNMGFVCTEESTIILTK